MQKFGWEGYIVTVQICIGAVIIIDVMLGIGAPENCPGMNEWSFLNIQLVKPMIEIEIETALVTVVPHHDRRMIHVLRYHFLNQFGTYLSIVYMVPSG